MRIEAFVFDCDERVLNERGKLRKGGAFFQIGKIDLMPVTVVYAHVLHTVVEFVCVESYARRNRKIIDKERQNKGGDSAQNTA